MSSNVHSVPSGSRSAEAGEGNSPTAMSLLQQRALDDLRRPRHVASVPDAHRDRATEQHGAVLPAACVCLRPMLPGSAGGIRRARRRFLPITPTFRPTRTAGWSMRGAMRSDARSVSHSIRSSLVTEIASNDGYLLQHFVAAGIPVLGIEPAANVAADRSSRKAFGPPWILRRDQRGEAQANDRPAGPVAGQQCPGARSGHQ